MIFQRNLSDSKSPQVSRAILNNILNFSSFNSCSNLSSLFTRFLGTFPKALNTTGITVTLLIHNFFSYRSRSRYFSKFLLYFIFTFFFLYPLGDECFSSCFLVGIWISISQTILSVSFSRTDSGLYIYHLSVRWNFSFSYSSQWITFPTQLILFLYSLYDGYVFNCYISITT